MDALHHKIISTLDTIKDSESKKIVVDDVLYTIDRMYKTFKLRMDNSLSVWFDRYELEDGILYLYQGAVIVGSLW